MAYYANGWNWSNIITTTGANTISIPLTYYPQGAPAPAKVKSALEWLADAVEEVCALARDVALV